MCYVGMTRAMDQLILTRAVYRRRYGTDLPEASVPSRFLEEVPAPLIEELGRRGSTARVGTGTPSASSGQAFDRPAGRSPAGYDADVHYSYEDEDQSASWKGGRRRAGEPVKSPLLRPSLTTRSRILPSSLPRGGRNSASRKHLSKTPTGKRGFRPGQKVRHPKYGEGTVYQREGEGEEAKITVQFPRFGLKKLVEKYAQLERA